jgi:SAM-dependent methyltransferase
MSNIENYVGMLTSVYAPGTNNHEQHNDNPKYWNILLGDVKNNPEMFENKIGLDFGCGKGRNVTNLLSLSKWERVDGIDISEDNINYCNNTYKQNSNFYRNNGVDLSDLKSDEYDFVMSTIVLQHLCARTLRLGIKKEIYRVLKQGGMFSFQMGYDSPHGHFRDYFDEFYDAGNSNGSFDVTIKNPEDLISDLKDIGFTNITYEIHESWIDGGHPSWIYVKCYK